MNIISWILAKLFRFWKLRWLRSVFELNNCYNDLPHVLWLSQIVFPPADFIAILQESPNISLDPGLLSVRGDQTALFSSLYRTKLPSFCMLALKINTKLNFLFRLNNLSQLARKKKKYCFILKLSWPYNILPCCLRMPDNVSQVSLGLLLSSRGGID